MHEYILMWKNIVNFRGRTSRREFWIAALVDGIVAAVLNFLAITEAETSYDPWFFYTLLSLHSLARGLPWISMTVRRLRDAGEDWKWMLSLLAGVLVSLVMLFIDSTFYLDDGKMLFLSLVELGSCLPLIIKLCKSSELSYDKSNNATDAKAYDPDKWICESCGTRNNNSAVTCKDCGNFRSRKVTVSEATAASDQNVWICKSCGGKNSLGSNFCNECGIRRS